jgi:ribonucleoside-diphosphate reductase alpha chain
LKTTYYLRTMAATSIEKSTGRAGQMNSVSNQSTDAIAAAAAPAMAPASQPAPVEAAVAATDVKFCAIDDPGCEACQ